ncbi:hypothetical protein ACT7C2_00445 [Bacillus pacificus]
MVADGMNSCFLISHPTVNYVMQAEKGFCSSSSYLILLQQMNITPLGNWEKNKTSFTVIEV